jgi:hypothetical protein
MHIILIRHFHYWIPRWPAVFHMFSTNHDMKLS